MMLSKFKLFFLALLVACTSSFALIDTISVDVGIAVTNTMPIGLVPFDQDGLFEAATVVERIAPVQERVGSRLLRLIGTSPLYHLRAGT